MMGLTAIEICAGAGGQSLGLHLAGFEHTLAVELDGTAALTLRHNFARRGLDPGLVREGDVADETVWKPSDYRGKVSLLAGGVPCPPFSVAGKQLGAADERDLFAWAVRTAESVQPEAVLLENVRGLNDARFGGYRQAVIDEFTRMGYQADWRLIEARDFGVPQLRPRMILVALRPEYVDYFEWPEAKRTEETVATVLAQLMGSRGFPYLDEWLERADSIAPTVVGGSKKHGGADLGPTRAKRAWEALWVDAHGIADLPPGYDWEREMHPRGPKLTVEMVQKIQGWHGPDFEDWEIRGRKTSRYRQIGNAFPPPVARAVGQSIHHALTKQGGAIRPAADRKMHDEVYRLLRDADDWMTANRISLLLGRTLDVSEVERRVDHLRNDFDVEERSRGGRVSYRLGEWKAFRGQAEHQRHEAFSSPKARRRIS
jgi:DNA (cytosine-5)-methyltransferase 1